MLPAKKRKPSLWRGFISFGHRNDSSSASRSSGVPDCIFDDRKAHERVLADLSRPNVKRRRAFTGLIRISDAGMPKNHAGISSAMKVGIIVFVIVDLLLVIFFLKSFWLTES